MSARLAAIALLLTATVGDAAVLCRTRSGRVTFRPTCHRSERVLDATELDRSVLAGAQGAPGIAGPTGTHPLKLVDSAGVELGPILILFGGFGAFVTITHPALGATVGFEVAPDGYAHNTAGAQSTVYYTSADCSGVPYLPFTVDPLPFAQIYGTAAYVPAGALHLQSYNSTERDPAGSPCGGGGTDTGRGTCCYPSPSSSANLSVGARVPLASLGFVPPFRTVPR